METKLAMSRSLPLGELLRAAGLPASAAQGSPEVEIRGLDYDSRRIGDGFLFFAFPGARADGREFALDALARRAAGVVSSSPAPAAFPGLWIRVPHGRRALALMARRFYSRAAEGILLTGITGTNGKTTTCCLVDTELEMAGHTTALAGTIEYHVAGEKRKSVNTTPESLDLYRLFDELAGRGGTHATLEVSSHALALGRVHGMRFHTAVWTNFTRDHLDFHSSMEEYFAAKCRLFVGEDTSPPLFAVLNADDKWARRIPVAPSTETIWYGMEAGAGLRAENIRSDFGGLAFEIVREGRRHPIRSPLVGRMNVSNILAAFGAGLTYGIAPEELADGIARRASVAGRFERVQAGQPFLVVVDYAHTDDALRNTIGAARSLTRNRVITLFGCGGDRDRTKRPLMGQAAGELSDFVVLTSDNPRGEDPIDIINDARAGLGRTDTPFAAEPDREKAIRIALAQAREGDVVLIAGKGHEDYQVLGDRTIHFDDREVAAKILKELGYAREQG